MLTCIPRRLFCFCIRDLKRGYYRCQVVGMLHSLINCGSNMTLVSIQRQRWLMTSSLKRIMYVYIHSNCELAQGSGSSFDIIMKNISKNNLETGWRVDGEETILSYDNYRLSKVDYYFDSLTTTTLFLSVTRVKNWYIQFH